MSIQWPTVTIECGRWKYLPDGHDHQECDSNDPSYVLQDSYGFDAARVEADGIEHWAVHMAEKDWVSDEDVGCFVRLVLIVRGTPGDQVRTEPSALKFLGEE